MTPPKRPSTPTAQRLRLVSVAVQPRLVLEEGDTLTEVNAEPFVVPAAKWVEWSSEAFTPTQLAQMLAALTRSDGA